VAVTCALCRLAGIAGPCPHHAGSHIDDGDPAETVSPLRDEWPHAAGSPGRKERRTLYLGEMTLSADEALNELDMLMIRSERIEIEHRWS
jgi:hypothetical protein